MLQTTLETENFHYLAAINSVFFQFSFRNEGYVHLHSHSLTTDESVSSIDGEAQVSVTMKK